MSSDPPPRLLESEIGHVTRYAERLDRRCGDIETKLDEIQRSVHTIELKLAEGKGSVRAYAAVVATLVGAGVSLLVAVLAKAMG